MAGFLSHGGHYEPIAIFATAWLGGLGGSVGVFLLARRHAERFATSRLGTILLPPKASAFLRKEYGRYGVYGLLLTRMLPGFRSVVAPFAGLSGLSLRQLMVPVAIATALWYGMLTWIGSRLGSRWDLVVQFLDNIYQVLGVTAIGISILIVVAIVWWRRTHRPR